MDAVPSGTVSLLFTDIEGSTRLLREAGDAYPGLLGRHRELLRAAFRAHGGHEVGTEGDGFFVVFASARDAVAAAADGQRALAAEAWPEGCEVRVRMGLHAGEPRVVDGDYVGIDVHHAARVMAAGHGGQVLLTQTTRDLLGDSVPVRDLGPQRLKDLPAPQGLYQLEVDGLPSVFHALRTLESRPMNLPVQPTPLIGREREIGDVCALLLRDDVRLVTLTGPGGVGKTSVALAVAAVPAERFRDGVVFVDLSRVADPRMVAGAILEALGVQGTAEIAARDQLIATLTHQARLLVLDNFEHVLDAAAVVAAVLDACAEVSVLATSRAPLGLRAEHRWIVRPLPIAARDADPHTLAHAPATALSSRGPLPATPRSVSSTTLRPSPRSAAHGRSAARDRARRGTRRDAVASGDR